MRKLTLIVGVLHAASAIDCIDFVISSNINFGGDDLKVVRISRGQAECEEECRKLTECKAYSMTKRGNQKCFLKKSSGQGFSDRSSHRFASRDGLKSVRGLSVKPWIGQGSADPNYLSGTKSSVFDLGGNVFDINYCRQIQRSRQCSSPPSCENNCPLGYKTDVYGCVASCDCKSLDNGEAVLVSF